jgi:3' exoribonuclease, RNase T-like
MKKTRFVYLDCEFLPADPSTRGLVSIGLTDHEGVDYYAVNGDMDVAALLAVPWMVDNVWPYLPRLVFGYDEPGRVLNHDDPAVQSIADIRAGVARYFADTDATETRLFAWYGGQDICRLHSLWDNDWSVMPDQIPRWFTEIEALIVNASHPTRPDLPKQDGGEHHALADARYNRQLHGAVLRHSLEMKERHR